MFILLVILNIVDWELIPYDDCFIPQKIPNLQDIEFVECVHTHVFCKSIHNQLYGWGNNERGKLGLSGTNYHCSPVLYTNWPDNIVVIKCGVSHTLVLTSNQEVFTCGNNVCGQLGRKLATTFDTSLIIVEGLSEITRIECGDYHSMCIDNYENLFVFGDNEYGQLGLGDTQNRFKPIKHPSLSNIIDISKGGDQTFVKTSNNEIYAFGNNEYSQLGIKTENIEQLTPIRVFENNEDIWKSNIPKSKAKSARK